MKNFGKEVIYEVYPKSFLDTTNSGLGDIKGVIKKIDYINKLGATCIWLTPIYPSPMNDNGYDVSDYTAINPDFGTMEDFEELIEVAKKYNIKIMIDLVFNHTSTDHIWFKKAMKGDKKYQDYYMFKDGKENLPPTNWISFFGGSTWEYVTKLNKYYLHIFDKTQADLNWENEEVRNEIYNIVNFWLEKGVKGFRFDVLNLISKSPVYEDDLEGSGEKYFVDGPNVHKYIKELNAKTFGRYEDIITVGEMCSVSINNSIKYSNPKEKELSMVFSFHHVMADYKDGNKWSSMDLDFIKLKNIISTWQEEVSRGGGWNALFWCNHDQPRIVSRYGDDKKFHRESATMLATAIHMLRGTPYIYQGEEIGMTNAGYKSIDQYKDIETLNYYKILMEKGVSEDKILKIMREKSRDNSRTPMQWNSDENAGFTKGNPWLSVNENYTTINAETAIKDKNSIFNYYRKLIKLRKEYDIISYGDYEVILKEHLNLYAYKRKYKNQELIVICNFYNNSVTNSIDTSEFKLLIGNYSDDAKLIRPYETRVYIK